MGIGISHPAGNITFKAPRGEEDRVGELVAYMTTNADGTAITSITTCWEMTDEEIAEIVRTKQVMMNVMGGGLPAHYISSATHMREFVTAFGKTWQE
jgi:hypothetical protein